MLLLFGMILLVLATLPSTGDVLAARQFGLMSNHLPFCNRTLGMLMAAVAMIVAGFTVAIVEGFCSAANAGTQAAARSLSVCV